MMYPKQLTLISLFALSPLTALAKTDLSGCTSFTSTVTVNPTAHEYGNVYNSLVYYDPDTLEICSAPDCGGGRAPPKTGVPGCPLYSGTAKPTPSFLSADPRAPPSTTSSVATAETSSAAVDTRVSVTEEVYTLMSNSETVTVGTVTTTLGHVNANATGASGGAQATGAGSTGVKGNATGNATGAATAVPSSPLDTTSSGDVLRVAMGGVSAALALAAAFVL